MSKTSIPTPKIPHDWKMDWQGPRDRRCGGGRRYLTIEFPGTGCVTADFLERTFRLGAVWSGKPVTTYKYEGIGWSQRLVDDAVAALRAVYTT